jgi:hypothetical protein
LFQPVTLTGASGNLAFSFIPQAPVHSALLHMNRLPVDFQQDLQPITEWEFLVPKAPEFWILGEVNIHDDHVGLG